MKNLSVISILAIVTNCFVANITFAQDNGNNLQTSYDAKDVQKAQRILNRGKGGSIGEKTLEDAESIVKGETPLNNTAIFQDAKKHPQQVVPTQNLAPQQPSPEELEKQRQALLQQRKEQLQNAFFPEIKPVTDKINESFFEKNKYWIIASIIILVCVVAFLLRPKRKIKLTPYQEAMLRFNTITKIADTLEVKPFAEEVSQIVRDYIDRVYHIPAPERTTQEFLELARNSTYFDDKAKEDLANMLKLADMAKFAKHSFSQNERTQIFETSINFVETDNQRANSKTTQTQ